MPNTTISVYLTDEEFIKYIKKKEIIYKKIKELVKGEIR